MVYIFHIYLIFYYHHSIIKFPHDDFLLLLIFSQFFEFACHLHFYKFLVIFDPNYVYDIVFKYLLWFFIMILSIKNPSFS